MHPRNLRSLPICQVTNNGLYKITEKMNLKENKNTQFQIINKFSQLKIKVQMAKSNYTLHDIGYLY